MLGPRTIADEDRHRLVAGRVLQVDRWSTGVVEWTIHPDVGCLPRLCVPGSDAQVELTVRIGWRFLVPVHHDAVCERVVADHCLGLDAQKSRCIRDGLAGIENTEEHGRALVRVVEGL